MNDALYDGQPDAGAGKISGSMQSLEYPEQFVGVSHVEAGTVIAHKKLHYTFLVTHRIKLDARLRLAGGIFPGVAQQIDQDYAQQPRIAPGKQVGANAPRSML
jgi:hypothetical protein